MGMMSLKCLWVITGKVLSRPAAGDAGLEVRKVCGAVVITVDRIVEVGGCPGTGCGVRRALDRALGGTASKGGRGPHTGDWWGVAGEQQLGPVGSQK